MIRAWKSLTVAALVFVGVGLLLSWELALLSLGIIFAAYFIGWAAGLMGYTGIPIGVIIVGLALLQTLPEFWVEGVLCVRAASDPAMLPNVFAGLSGAMKILLGAGFSIIYLVFFFSRKGRCQAVAERTITLEPIQAMCIIVMPLGIVMLWIIYFMQQIHIVVGIISIVLFFFSVGFIYLSQKRYNRLHPSDDPEAVVEEVPAFVLKMIRRRDQRVRKSMVYLWAAVFGVGGGGLLLFCGHPFVEALIHDARRLGISEFIMIMYLAPFATELPEKLTAINFARHGREGEALVNFISSVASQSLLLTGMLPVVYYVASLSGTPVAPTIPLGEVQLRELLLVIWMLTTGFLMLLDLCYEVEEALWIGIFFLIQFFGPILFPAYAATIIVFAISFNITLCVVYVTAMLIRRRHLQVFSVVKSTLWDKR